MCDDWDDNVSYSNHVNDGNDVNDEPTVGKSFGKGRGFTPNNFGDRRGRGGRGNRGGRFNSDRNGEGGYRRNDRYNGGSNDNDQGNDNRGGSWGSGNNDQGNDYRGGGGWGSGNNDLDTAGESRGRGGGRGRGRGRGGRDGNRGRDRDDDGGSFGDNGGDKSDQPERPPIYVPAEITDDEINATGIGVGINFKDYDNIKVNVGGENPPRPIQSFQQAGLRPLVLENLKYFKYESPTPIQKYAIPIIMQGRDLMATAQTGSGKTAAFLLPIIHNLLENSADLVSTSSCSEPKALILSPTRELTTQIFCEARKFCRNSMIRVAQVYGGTAVSYQSKRVLDGAHILVATPGRLGDFLNRGVLALSSLKFFVLDEADRMLDMGFRTEIEKFFNHNTISSVEERQTLMFSATFDQDIQKLAQNYLRNYIFLAVGIVGGACKDVEQVFVQTDKRDKKNKLWEVLQQERTTKGTLVFVETKRTADFIASYISEKDVPTTSIHGDRFQNQREEALRDFKSGRMDVLVATSVAARGLDIKGVRHVINYDLPKNIDDYVHRIGRTGRLGNQGKATSFYDPSEDSQLASSLITILEQADQNIPEWLKADRGGTSSDYRTAEYGAYDLRNQTGGNQTEEIVGDENW